MRTRLETEEEAKESRERLKAYYDNGELWSQLMAILMDMTIGGFGLHEHIARDKAESIIEMLQPRIGKAVNMARLEGLK